MSSERTGLQLQSQVNADGTLKVSLVTVEAPAPRPHEVVVRIEAAPLNPSDLGLLLAGADPQALAQPEPNVITGRVPDAALRTLSARLGLGMPVGNEGAGVVVEAGAQAQGLLGKRVALLGGATYSQLRTVAAQQCAVLPDEASFADGAAAFVNPLTALSMLEVMRREGHTALVHTAAASNLGQMLQRLCGQEGVGLVNVVRRPEQVELLRGLGAQHVVSSSSPAFLKELIAAVDATSATLAFDAVGGGKLASQLLTAMEAVLSSRMKEYSRYGSHTHKQVYIYGMLDRSPTELTRSYGLQWSVGGWLVTPFLQRLGEQRTGELKARVMRELTTTFKSHYAGELSFAEALTPQAMARFSATATGQKYLLAPNRR